MTKYTADRIAGILAEHRFICYSEADVQQSVAEALLGAAAPFQREVELAKGDRIDFLAGRVGIEVKVKGGASAILAQLQRYARSHLVDELILATTRHLHVALLSTQSTVGGKPLRVVRLSGGLL